MTDPWLVSPFGGKQIDGTPNVAAHVLIYCLREVVEVFSRPRDNWKISVLVTSDNLERAMNICHLNISQSVKCYITSMNITEYSKQKIYKLNRCRTQAVWVKGALQARRTRRYRLHTLDESVNSWRVFGTAGKPIRWHRHLRFPVHVVWVNGFWTEYNNIYIAIAWLQIILRHTEQSTAA